jgi:hypothetical protein
MINWFGTALPSLVTFLTFMVVCVLDTDIHFPVVIVDSPTPMIGVANPGNLGEDAAVEIVFIGVDSNRVGFKAPSHNRFNIQMLFAALVPVVNDGLQNGLLGLLDLCHFGLGFGNRVHCICVFGVCVVPLFVLHCKYTTFFWITKLLPNIFSKNVK